ncbi:SMP-30/gluconolactonase/LRE family protein [Gilvimarinus sp. DA14]|uniref:SMP-30/gluconolactonase/LRE family protein n=1 Tax=Gilvimarinus sp. DA14 TaxID=2956798 RepID=UPI0020B82E9F|nr:SMP-30/gluconolactonase/LRE family protein [Gilvimarinus sp. DA14]UTF59112.1 SMP-30/gluconolactonase/LRE family protein [Gilvimarinus sp. DA14]
MAIDTVELVAEIAVGCELGEGVLWDDIEQRLWWTDILDQCLYSAAIDGGELKRWPAPEAITAFGFTSELGQLICSFASGIGYFWPATGQRQWLARPALQGAARFNDGRVDPWGNFWAGTLSPGAQKAKLYRYDGRLSEERVGLEIANGLCWSPDGKRAYHADSPRREIHEFTLCGGHLGRGRLFARTPEGVFPDGACTDAAGNLWSAQWGGAQVVCYSNTGAVIATLELPVSQPSCVAFGGPQLHHLVVTSAWENMTQTERKREPRAGNVFVYRTPFQGRLCDRGQIK